MTKNLSRLSKELTLAQKWKDGEWLQNQVISGRLHPLYLEYLPKLIVSLNEIYPNNWDMVFHCEMFNQMIKDNTGRQIGIYRKVKLTISPIILFDLIHIKNSQKKSLAIKNIFVKIPISINKRIEYRPNNEKVKIEEIYFDSIRGTRTNLTFNEYSQGYLHSHLPSNIFTTEIKFDNFCTGSGEINFMFSKINHEYTDGMFKTILFHLKGYLEWESLEGRPHISINYLFLKSKSGDLHYYSNKICNDFVWSIMNEKKKKFKLDNILPDLDWQIVDNKYRIKDNEKFEEFCRFKGNTKTDYQPNVVTYKDNQGNYFPSNATIENIKIPDDYIPFKGKKYKLEVSGVLDDSDKPFYLHPKIKKHVREYLEYTTNKNAVRKSIAKTTH